LPSLSLGWQAEEAFWLWKGSRQLSAKRSSIEINVTGFDTGQGMPAPTDYRDLPHVWNEGFYRMDVAKLKGQLEQSAELILGDIEETQSSWSPKGSIGFVAFDVDYYTSTTKALRLFQDDHNRPCLATYLLLL
jgi:hypothetical protein